MEQNKLMFRKLYVPEQGREHALELGLLALCSREEELDRQLSQQVSRILHHLQKD
jgi:hypothetical protein